MAGKDECNICGEQFPSQDYLLRHIFKDHHFPSMQEEERNLLVDEDLEWAGVEYTQLYKRCKVINTIVTFFCVCVSVLV